MLGPPPRLSRGNGPGCVTRHVRSHGRLQSRAALPLEEIPSWLASSVPTLASSGAMSPPSPQKPKGAARAPCLLKRVPRLRDETPGPGGGETRSIRYLDPGPALSPLIRPITICRPRPRPLKPPPPRSTPDPNAVREPPIPSWPESHAKIYSGTPSLQRLKSCQAERKETG